MKEGSILTQQARKEVRNILDDMLFGGVESRLGLYSWAANVKEVVSRPSRRGRLAGHLRLTLDVAKFLSDGVAPSRIYQIYSIARADKN